MSQTLRKIHDYLVGDEIARGSFSTIRIAYHNTSFQQFAFKLLSKKKLSETARGIDMIYGEGIIASLLSHPNIIKIHDVIETSTSVFVIMDYCEESDLLTFIYEHNPPNRFLIQKIDQILSAVEYLHNHDLCHRDLKPENILLSDDCTAKLTDFGFVTFCDGCSNSGKCGSFGYAAPEIFTEVKYDGQAADIWSIGVLIYTLFNRQCPFNDQNSTQYHPENLSYSKIPHDFVPILKRALSLDPTERPTIHEFRTALHFPAHYPEPCELCALSDKVLLRLADCAGDVDLSQLKQVNSPQRNLYDLIEAQYIEEGVIKPKEIKPREMSHVVHSLPGDALMTEGEELKTIGTVVFPEIYPLVVMESVREYLLAKRFTYGTQACGKQRAVFTQSAADVQLEIDFRESQFSETILTICTNAAGVEHGKELLAHANRNFGNHII